VVGFRIVAGIGQCRVDSDVAECRVEQRNKAIGVDARTTTGENADHEVSAAIEGGFQFRIAAVSDGLPMLCAAVATTDVVAAGMTAVQTGRVESRSLDAFSAFEEAANGGAEESLRHGTAQQASRSFLQRGEVGHGRQADNVSQVRVLDQMHGDAAIVGFEKCLEDQAGEQLRLCVFLRTETMRVIRQRGASRCQGVARYPDR